VSELATLSVAACDGVTVVAVAGEVDISNEAAVSNELRALVPNSAGGLVLDLARLTYLDSAGLRLLVALAARLRERQQVLVAVLPPGSPVRRLLELAGIDAAVPVFDDVAAAAARVAQQASPPT
jgi:stage II sporulation protein AA (anti-sigma F factor antagonist)